MQNRIVEVTVGLFFLLGIGAFAVLALKVSGLADMRETHKTYTVTASFENVGGLKPRSRVVIAGVKIGRVSQIYFDPKDYVARVTFAIHKEVGNIPDDSRVSILTSGLLGENYLSLTPGFSTSYLKEGDHIPMENTNKAVVFEELVAQFLAGQTSGLR